MNFNSHNLSYSFMIRFFFILDHPCFFYFLGIIPQQYVFWIPKLLTKHPPILVERKSPFFSPEAGHGSEAGQFFVNRPWGFAAMEAIHCRFVYQPPVLFFFRWIQAPSGHMAASKFCCFAEEMCGEILFKIDCFSKKTRRSKIFAKFTLCFFSQVLADFFGRNLELLMAGWE